MKKTAIFKVKFVRQRFMLTTNFVQIRSVALEIKCADGQTDTTCPLCVFRTHCKEGIKRSVKIVVDLSNSKLTFHPEGAHGNKKLKKSKAYLQRRKKTKLTFCYCDSYASRPLKIYAYQIIQVMKYVLKF
jgi:hypothetical protein